MFTPDKITVLLLVFVRPPLPANMALMLPLATAKLLPVNTPPVPVMLPSVSVTTPTESLYAPRANRPPLTVSAPLAKASLMP